ncbi:type III secretion system translocon subunit SctE [Acanthopleuribacter pedis]|uniref:Type III secretion system translocon subunit SctE n=1 Tax=Acanthopleuribacter pedis TaxID=442870 RepID=A0A8J7QRF7_9BACT|nr:type III secretion system translocon subunit SctE [Acanthopleuribacter pedis]MBO1323330.1 type III secretion system translocon subunit SctE [Acanthopleuribacter pedis]
MTVTNAGALGAPPMMGAGPADIQNLAGLLQQAKELMTQMPEEGGDTPVNLPAANGMMTLPKPAGGTQGLNHQAALELLEGVSIQLGNLQVESGMDSLKEMQREGKLASERKLEKIAEMVKKIEEAKKAAKRNKIFGWIGAVAGLALGVLTANPLIIAGSVAMISVMATKELGGFDALKKAMGPESYKALMGTVAAVGVFVPGMAPAALMLAQESGLMEDLQKVLAEKLGDKAAMGIVIGLTVAVMLTNMGAAAKLGATSSVQSHFPKLVQLADDMATPATIVGTSAAMAGSTLGSGISGMQAGLMNADAVTAQARATEFEALKESLQEDWQSTFDHVKAVVENTQQASEIITDTIQQDQSMMSKTVNMA